MTKVIINRGGGLDGFSRIKAAAKTAKAKSEPTGTGPKTVEEINLDNQYRKETARQVIQQQGGFVVLISQVQDFDKDGNLKAEFIHLTQWKMNEEKGYYTRRNKFNLKNGVIEPLFKVLAHVQGYEIQ